MPTDAIHINIWDDYNDDGFVSEGKVQETYAYVEDDLDDDNIRAVLEHLQHTIESIKPLVSGLICRIEWYDSAAVYPNLIGTEYARHLYKRWQLLLVNLTHREREQLIEALGRIQLRHNGKPVIVYSES